MIEPDGTLHIPDWTMKEGTKMLMKGGNLTSVGFTTQLSVSKAIGDEWVAKKGATK